MKYNRSVQQKIKTKYFSPLKLNGYSKKSKVLDQSTIINLHTLHNMLHGTLLEIQCYINSKVLLT